MVKIGGKISPKKFKKTDETKQSRRKLSKTTKVKAERKISKKISRKIQDLKKTTDLKIEEMKIDETK